MIIPMCLICDWYTRLFFLLQIQHVILKMKFMAVLIHEFFVLTLVMIELKIWQVVIIRGKFPVPHCKQCALPWLAFVKTGTLAIFQDNVFLYLNVMQKWLYYSIPSFSVWDDLFLILYRSCQY